MRFALHGRTCCPARAVPDSARSLRPGGVSFFASSAESVGEFRLGKRAQGVKEGDFDAFFGAKTIRLSDGQFGFVVETLDSARGDGPLGAKPIE